MTLWNNLVRIITGNLQTRECIVNKIEHKLTLFIFGDDARECEEEQEGERGARRGPGAPGRVSHVRHTIPHHTWGLRAGPSLRPVYPWLLGPPSIRGSVGRSWGHIDQRRRRRGGGGGNCRACAPHRPPHRFSLITTRKGGIRGFYRSSR